MPTIDADAHVIESEQTWDYIEDDKLRPVSDHTGWRSPAKLANRREGV